MARQRKTEPAKAIEPVTQAQAQAQPELLIGTFHRVSYEPGTMSAPPFVTFTVGENETVYEVRGRLATYLSLINNEERVTFLVEGHEIVGMA